MGIIKKTVGYTLIEILIATSIFSAVIITGGSTVFHFYETQRREKLKNEILVETQFFLNRISQMIRNNTIDYAEYYSNGRETPIIYGNQPKEYEWHFYNIAGCPSAAAICEREDELNFNEGYFDTFADNVKNNDQSSNNAIVSEDGTLSPYLQHELYLISADGSTKTILRRMGNGEDDDSDGSIDEDFDGNYWDHSSGQKDGGERLGMLQMVPEDTNGDGIFDQFVTTNDFQQDGDSDPELEDLIPISPQNIVIESLDFYVSPLEDPRKAFKEKDVNVQMQPHITIVMTVRNTSVMERRLGVYRFSLQTTVSSRVLNNVTF